LTFAPDHLSVTRDSCILIAKILECTWDESEDYPGDTALSKTDKAMNQFVNLLVEHQTSAPDSAKFKAVYNAYLEKLKRAD
jgi:hypothetical protein